jgi:4-hydroxy-tetrahydrodipicolinate synthase
MFKGCGTALVTPFTPEGQLDEAAMRRLVRRQVEAGIDFLVPCGTTGESPTLSREEHLRVVEITAEEAGETPVMAGAGGYNTHEVVELARACERLKVQGLLSVTPYYNRPTQEGLYRHYKALTDAVSLPVLVYSVQGRTGVNVEPSTLARLAEIPSILGVKEASGNLAQIARVIYETPDRFLVLSGDDAVTIPVIALGGHGVISVVSNQIPAEMTALSTAARKGDLVEARRLQRQFLPLMDINFIESSPGPVKYALARMGLLEPVWRLPLVPPSAASQGRIDAVLTSAGLI